MKNWPFFIDIIKRHLDYFYEHFFPEIGMQLLMAKGPALGHNINVYLEMKIVTISTWPYFLTLQG